MLAPASIADERAVSQVVTAVFLIAILLLLVAVLGPIVIGIGNDATQGSPAPQATVEWSYDGSGTLTIQHKGGDTIQKDRIRIVGSKSGEFSPTWSDADDSMAVEDEGSVSGVASDEIVRVFWNDPEDDSQQLIARWVGPDTDPPDGRIAAGERFAHAPARDGAFRRTAITRGRHTAE